MSQPPPWWDDLWQKLEQRWLKTRRTGTLLIEGGIGLGAGELSRRVALALLCLDDERHPCGCCPACRLFHAGTHPDFHGPAAVDGRYGIEDLRSWSMALVRRPVVSRRTVLWLPAAERLALAAANALLKTLEEPPLDAILVLSTFNVRTLPVTILSRAEVYRLTVPPHDQALTWLGAQRATEPRVLASLLALAGGAPYLALRYHDFLGVEERLDAFAGTLARLFGTPAEALEAARRIHEGTWLHTSGRVDDLEDLDAARIFGQWLLAYLGDREGLGADLLVPEILQRSWCPLSTLELLEILGGVRELLHSLGTGVNELLAWEALALRCAQRRSDGPSATQASGNSRTRAERAGR